jgi:hypothetical protein
MLEVFIGVSLPTLKVPADRPLEWKSNARQNGGTLRLRTDQGAPTLGTDV